MTRTFSEKLNPRTKLWFLRVTVIECYLSKSASGTLGLDWMLGKRSSILKRRNYKEERRALSPTSRIRRWRTKWSPDSKNSRETLQWQGSSLSWLTNAHPRLGMNGICCNRTLGPHQVKSKLRTPLPNIRKGTRQRHAQKTFQPLRRKQNAKPGRTNSRMRVEIRLPP